MSKYSEYLKSVKENETKKFFGEIKKVSNKYFAFDHVIDEDNFIIITNNIIMVKGNPVMVVGENKVVYLKDWNVKLVHNYFEGIDAYAVKINRKYFKVYTFKNIIDGYEGMKEETFDDLKAIAATQEMKISLGHMK